MSPNSSSKDIFSSKYIAQDSHVFLGLIPYKISALFFKRLSIITSFFANINPLFKEDLEAIDHAYSPQEYVGVGLVNYSILGAVLGFLLWQLSITQGREENIALLVGVGTFLGFTFFMTYFSTKAPGFKLKADAIDVDRTLVYGLKEMVLQADSGGNLFESMVALSEGNYGALSREFDIAVRRINTGMSISKALELMVKRTRSTYFKKAIWQLINSVNTGSELKTTITPIIKELDAFQKSQIQNYARELNLWSLMYMMFSVAIPTIGSTMLVVLSVFADFGVTEGFFMMFVGINLLVQMGLIFFVKSRRPNVSF